MENIQKCVGMSTETIERMRVGINYPWIDYGWDFGIPPPAWVHPGKLEQWRARKRVQILDDFRRFAELGLFAVRWFMLADGLSYGTGEEAPRLIDGRWRFDPLPADHPFHWQLIEDFAFVLEVCSETGVRLVPSLIDFHWCHEGKSLEGGIVKGGRGDVLRDEEKRRRFFDHVLEPLLDVSVRRPDTIYAWEIINEPEWVTKRRYFSWLQRDKNKTIPYQSMIEFIREGIGRINSRGLPSSVGFAHWDAMNKWNSGRLGISVPQFHYYAPDRREIPVNPFSPGTPCFIGEFATTFLRGWPDLDDLDRPIPVRLRNLEAKRYSAAFLWSARAKDNATKWEPDDHRDTLAFLNSAGRGDVIA